MTKEFMMLTIAAHGLQCLTEQEAANLTPSVEKVMVMIMLGEIERPPQLERLAYTSERVRFLRDNTDWYERDDILVAENDYTCPSLEHFEKSFGKWLGLQKHAVKAVNSLHNLQTQLWRRHRELNDELYDLEEWAQNGAAAPCLESLLARKNREERELTELARKLCDASDKVKGGQAA